MDDNTNAAEAPREVVLGGLVFQLIDFNLRTVRMDHYLAREIRVSGIDKVMPMDGETNLEYMLRLQTLLLDSGRASRIIAGMLVPEGSGVKDWTVQMAEKTAKHIETCNTQEDREMVVQLALEVAYGFFRQGLLWLKRFLSSSQIGPSKNSEEPEHSQAALNLESGSPS